MVCQYWWIWGAFFREKYEFAFYWNYSSFMWISQPSLPKSHLKLWTGFCWRNNVRICSCQMSCSSYSPYRIYLKMEIGILMLEHMWHHASRPTMWTCSMWRNMWTFYVSSVHLQWIDNVFVLFLAKCYHCIADHDHFNTTSCNLPVAIVGGYWLLIWSSCFTFIIFLAFSHILF